MDNFHIDVVAVGREADSARAAALRLRYVERCRVTPDQADDIFPIGPEAPVQSGAAR